MLREGDVVDPAIEEMIVARAWPLFPNLTSPAPKRLVSEVFGSELPEVVFVQPIREVAIAARIDLSTALPAVLA